MSGIRIKDLPFKSNPSPEDLLVIHDESSGEERKIPLGLTDIGDKILSQNSIWVGNSSGVPTERLINGTVLTWLETPTSANLSSTLDSKTGTGALVFGTSPNLAGVPTAPTPTLSSPSNQIATVGLLTTVLGTGVGSLPNITQNSIWVGNSSGVPTEKLINGTVLTWLETPTSANLSSTLDSKTGTGALVFGTSPNLAGVPTAPTPTLSSPSNQIATVGLLLDNPAKTVFETVKNVSGVPLQKGTPLRVIGSTGNEATVTPANALNSYPAHLILNEDLQPEESGLAVALGFINNVSVPDASLYTPGQEVWLGSAGGWVTSPPTGNSRVQKLGVILRVNTSTNKVSGIVLGTGVEGLPNITQNSIWVGNSSGTPTEKLINGTVLTWLETPTSANLSSTLDSKTGTGALVFGTSPNLAGVPTAPTPTLSSPSNQIATVGLLTTPQTAQTVFCGPDFGSDAAPTFRRLKPFDLPRLVVVSGVDSEAISLDDVLEGLILECTSNNPVTITVPAGLKQGYNITVTQVGNGRVEFQPAVGSGIILYHPDGHNKTRKRWSQVFLYRRNNSEYVLSGDTDG